jgi:hypothetical protein
MTESESQSMSHAETAEDTGEERLKAEGSKVKGKR